LKVRKISVESSTSALAQPDERRSARQPIRRADRKQFMVPNAFKMSVAKLSPAGEDFRRGREPGRISDV